LAGVQVVALGISVLRLAEKDIRMVDIHAGVETVAAADAEPIHVGDAAAAALRARAAPTIVVLKTGVDVVRPLVVSSDDVGETGGHRCDEVPGLALVPADVQAAVVADHEVLAVARIDPDRVLVNVRRRVVATGIVERGESLSGVERLRDRETGDVDRVRVLRIDTQLTEIHRPRMAVAHEGKRAAAIVGAEHTAARRVELRRRRWRRHRRLGGYRTTSASSTSARAAAAGVHRHGCAVVAPIESAAAATTATT